MPDRALRVGFSVDALSPSLTGIGRYSWELCAGLTRRNDIGCVAFYRRSEPIPDPGALLSADPRPYWYRMSRRHLRRARQMLTGGHRFDVFHGPNYMLPEWVGRGIITIHDLSVFKFPETHPEQRRAAFEKRFSQSLERAAHIITDCETVRREVIAFAGCAGGMVTAIPLGVGRHLRPLAFDERLGTLQRLGLPVSGYGLTVSTIEPRKRIDRLVAAWRLLPPRMRERFPLVIAGAGGWQNEALLAEIARAAGEGWVIPLGFIAEGDLPALHSGASVFVFPSVYEGFGLPPLEAMASGVPTMVADASCLPEVTRGAAMLVDPEDTRSFAEAIMRALDDEVWRRHAVSAGIQVASHYTWDDCVDRTVQVYRRVARGDSYRT